MGLPAVAARWRTAASSVILAVLLVLAVLMLGHRYCTRATAFSDNLFSIEVTQCLLKHGAEVRGYYLPAAPYAFPDMVFALVAVALWHKLIAIFLTYNFMYYGLLLAALTALLRQTGLRLRTAFLSAGSGLLFLLTVHIDDPYLGRALLLFQPTNHVGVILVGLVLSLLVVRELHRRVSWGGAAAFIVLGGLTMFSDRLLLPQFLAPICVTAVLLAVCRLVPVRKPIEILLLTAAAYGLYVGLGRVFSHYFVLQPLRLFVDTAQIPQAWANFLKTLPQYLEGQFLVKATFLTFVPVAAVVAWRHVRAARSGRAQPAAEQQACCARAAVALIGLLSCGLTLGAVILSGVARLQCWDRYALAAVLVPLLFLPGCARFLPSRPLRWVGRACPAAIILFACAQVALCHRHGLPLKELRLPYPEEARVLDRLARENKIGHGLATFWHARSLWYLTHKHVPVHTILPDGEPQLHSQNPYGYLLPGRRSLQLPHYDFIFFMERDPPVYSMDRAHFEARFGTPRATIPAGKGEVWLYDGLLGNDLNLFLRSTLADRCRRIHRTIGPTSPATLAVPKENGADPSQPGTVTLAPEGEVELKFDAPVKGEMIDLGAQYDAHFDLLFYHGTQLLGTLYVPRINVPLISGEYRKTGNQSRLLTLPEGVRGRPWTSVIVRGKGGPGCFALGHFLVYPRTPPGLQTRQARVGGRWRFEAEAQPGRGAVVEDPSASSGRARLGARDFADIVVYGPYAFLDRGRYRVEFFVKADAGKGSDPLARLEVVSGCGCRLHAQRELVPGDFADANGYRTFNLTVTADVELSDCEFRVAACGRGPVYVDHIDLICEE
jgi:hypothetical protein